MVFETPDFWCLKLPIVGFWDSGFLVSVTQDVSLACAQWAAGTGSRPTAGKVVFICTCINVDIYIYNVHMHTFIYIYIYIHIYMLLAV